MAININEAALGPAINVVVLGFSFVLCFGMVGFSKVGFSHRFTLGAVQLYNKQFYEVAKDINETQSYVLSIMSKSLFVIGLILIASVVVTQLACPPYRAQKKEFNLAISLFYILIWLVICCLFIYFLSKQFSLIDRAQAGYAKKITVHTIDKPQFISDKTETQKQAETAYNCLFDDIEATKEGKEYCPSAVTMPIRQYTSMGAIAFFFIILAVQQVLSMYTWSLKQ